MTVNNTQASVSSPGNGATTAFNFGFEIPYQIDGVTPAVLVYTIDPFGNVAQLTPASYGITGVANAAGGTVTYQPASGPLPAGWELVITRNLFLQQGFSFLNTGFYPKNVEYALDALVMMLQQLDQSTLSVLVGDTVPTLPVEAARANQVAGWDANGNFVAFNILPLVTVAVVQALANLNILTANTGTGT